MKRLLLLSLIIILSGCSSGGIDTKQDKTQNERGGFTVAYEFPLDTDHVEMFVSTVPNFIPTGWDPNVYNEKYVDTPGYTSGSWTNKPNDLSQWNGIDRNLYSTHAPVHRIEVNGLTVGKTYYYKIVVVDKAGQRSIPSAEQTVTTGGPPKSSTVIVAASDASPASKAGADFVCDGTDDQETIQQALDFLQSQSNGKIMLTEGSFIVSDSIKIHSNIQIEGQGDSTIFSPALNITKDINGIFTNDDYTNGTSNFSISRIAIDGKKAEIPSNYLVTGLTFTNISEARIEKTSIFNAYYGMFLTDIKDSFIIGNTIKSNRYGLFVNNGNNRLVTISDNISKNNNEIGIRAGTLTLSSISNNIVSENYYDGIDVMGCKDCKISGNICDSNGVFSQNFYSNITVRTVMTLTSSNNSIINNTCRKGNNVSKYGIYIESGDGSLVTGNDCTGGGVTAGIQTNGTATNTNYGSGNRVNSGAWSVNPS